MNEVDWDGEDHPCTTSEGFDFSGILGGFVFILWFGRFSYLCLLVLTRFEGDFALGTDDNTDGVNEDELL